MVRRRGAPKRAAEVGVNTAVVIEGRRNVVSRKIIDRLKALSPSLVASGALVDARHSSLVSTEPPRTNRSAVKR